MMMMDFETAERKAFSQIFPGIRVRGCTFHYGQAVLRNIGFIGLKLQYADENSLVRAWVRELLALPFLPSFLVGDAWEMYLRDPRQAVNHAGQPFAIIDPQTWQLLIRFGNYFITTWLSRIEEWNHYTNDSHRTNNVPVFFTLLP